MDNKYQDQKVLILGLGLNQGGVGAAKFFYQQGAQVKVTDLKTKEELQPSLDLLKNYPNIEYTLGEHKLEDIAWADLIIRNPALKPDNQYLQYAQKLGKQVEMDMGIFLQYISPHQIIGVTGTKGKSTTTSLIYEILKAAGKKVLFAGNIGKSVLDTIPFLKEDSLVLLELSSFQLQAFHEHQISPKWSIITNIYPDHLNYHGTMENYIKAKWGIAQYQKPDDHLFLPASQVDVLHGYNLLKDFQGQVKYFSAGDLPEDFQPQLPGKHNLANMAAALALVQTLGIDQILALEIMKNFQGVEYRLQLIYNKDGLKIYNDSTATNPEATVQALNSLPNSILICGGVNKDLPYDELTQAILKQTKAVYFLEGTATEEILRQLNDYGSRRIPFVEDPRWKLPSGLQTTTESEGRKTKIEGVYNNLENLLSNVKKTIQPSDIILFSPGAASFNLFKNEFDRGEKFNQAVGKIFQK